MKLPQSRYLVFCVLSCLGLGEAAYSRNLNQRSPRSADASAETGNIRDPNYAFEGQSFSEQQIKQQEGVKVLNQANSINQKALRLSE